MAERIMALTSRDVSIGLSEIEEGVNPPYVEQPDPDVLRVVRSADSRLRYVQSRLSVEEVRDPRFDIAEYVANLLVDRVESHMGAGNILVGRGSVIRMGDVLSVLQHGSDNGSEVVVTRALGRRSSLPGTETWQTLNPHQFPGLIVYNWENLSRIGQEPSGSARRLLGKPEQGIRAIYFTDRLVMPASPQ